MIAAWREILSSSVNPTEQEQHKMPMMGAYAPHDSNQAADSCKEHFGGEGSRPLMRMRPSHPSQAVTGLLCLGNRREIALQWMRENVTVVVVGPCVDGDEMAGVGTAVGASGSSQGRRP
ncbi:hypothetical protein Vafri_12072, partial [Volvox africanus]